MLNLKQCYGCLWKEKEYFETSSNVVHVRLVEALFYKVYHCRVTDIKICFTRKVSKTRLFIHKRCL